jgi:hypothetical protein
MKIALAIHSPLACLHGTAFEVTDEQYMFLLQLEKAFEQMVKDHPLGDICPQFEVITRERPGVHVYGQPN